MSNGIFVTGTDTGVGKTIITGLLARSFQENGQNIITQKWIQCGPDTDLADHDRLSGLRPPDKLGKARNPYHFEHPVSPHFASKLEETPISRQKILDALCLLHQTYDTIIVEGAGGFLVPMTNDTLIADLVTETKFPILLVAENRVGMLNHTLLTLEALRARGLSCLGIVVNRVSQNGHETALIENIHYLKEKTGVPLFGELKFNDNVDLLWSDFQSIGSQIQKAFKCHKP